MRSWCRRFGRKPYDAVLDRNYMWSAMKGIPDAERRGRPDIVHYFLLTVLESPAGKKGLVDVYIHARNNETFYVEPGTRIPRAYNRFIGILSALLRGEDTPRIHPVEREITDLIEEKKGNGYRVVVMDELGRRALPEDVVERNTAVIIGGFPKGTFRKIYPYDDRVSIHEEPLTSWAVGAEVVAGWERRFLFPGI